METVSSASVSAPFSRARAYISPIIGSFAVHSNHVDMSGPCGYSLQKDESEPPSVIQTHNALTQWAFSSLGHALGTWTIGGETLALRPLRYSVAGWVAAFALWDMGHTVRFCGVFCKVSQFIFGETGESGLDDAPSFGVLPDDLASVRSAAGEVAPRFIACGKAATSAPELVHMPTRLLASRG